jgi:hypothetical protein
MDGAKLARANGGAHAECCLNTCSTGRASIGISELIGKNAEVIVVRVESSLEASAVGRLWKVQDASHDPDGHNLLTFAERYSFPGDQFSKVFSGAD